MSVKKVAAENSPEFSEKARENLVVVREYNEESDKFAVEEVERRCETVQRGKPTLVTDLMGDPVCRVRHFPTHIVLVTLELRLHLQNCSKLLQNSDKKFLINRLLSMEKKKKLLG